MTITITDPVLLEQLRAVTDTVAVRGPDGTVVAMLSPPNKFMPPPGFVLPYSEEELTRRWAEEPTGRTLADIIRDLEDRQ